ncbi:alpha/beta fold hydrolase [Actinoplanes sp. NPDC049599]|uniref:alpha/beta fold hydrolase n=1 Tax=Actinoplanes sp. NPDC049599 TaxID=3363903 RepID=UPI0037975944
MTLSSPSPPLRTDQRLPAPAGAWAYDLWGRHGRPLVLIPAILFDRLMWWPAAADLRPYATVVAVDLPGHGESPARARYDPDELVDDLAELVAGLGGTRAPVVVGHGASAALALRFAARYASHAVVTVDAPDDCRRPVPREEYLARMRLDTLPECYRDLVRPAADPGLLAAYGSCVDLEAPPAAPGTARLDVRSTDYGVPGRFAHLTAASRFVGALGALL